MTPTECKLCGAGIVRSADGITGFRCGSAYCVETELWVDGISCADRLRDRIRRALETLKTAKRHDFVVNFMSSMQQRDDGDFVEFDDVDQVIQILEGESNETE